MPPKLDHPPSPPSSTEHPPPPDIKALHPPRQFSHDSLNSAEAVRRCLVIHSIIIFDYYNSLHFIFRKFMQLNLNHFIKQIVTTLCLAVETFLFSPFPNCDTQHSPLAWEPPHPPSPFRHKLSKFLHSRETIGFSFLKLKKCRCVCFRLLISCFHVNLVFLFPLESGGWPRAPPRACL